MLDTPETDTFLFISFLEELRCVVGFQSYLVNEYQHKCRGATRADGQASIIAEPDPSFSYCVTSLIKDI